MTCELEISCRWYMASAMHAVVAKLYRTRKRAMLSGRISEEEMLRLANGLYLWLDHSVEKVTRPMRRPQ